MSPLCCGGIANTIREPSTLRCPYEKQYADSIGGRITYGDDEKKMFKMQCKRDMGLENDFNLFSPSDIVRINIKKHSKSINI